MKIGKNNHEEIAKPERIWAFCWPPSGLKVEHWC